MLLTADFKYFLHATNKLLTIVLCFSYRLTQIAVDWQVEGAEGHRYDVIFIGTSK